MKNPDIAPDFSFTRDAGEARDADMWAIPGKDGSYSVIPNLRRDYEQQLHVNGLGAVFMSDYAGSGIAHLNTKNILTAAKGKFRGNKFHITANGQLQDLGGSGGSAFANGYNFSPEYQRLLKEGFNPKYKDGELTWSNKRAANVPAAKKAPPARSSSPTNVSEEAQKESRRVDAANRLYLGTGIKKRERAEMEHDARLDYSSLAGEPDVVYSRESVVAGKPQPISSAPSQTPPSRPQPPPEPTNVSADELPLMQHEDPWQQNWQRGMRQEAAPQPSASPNTPKTLGNVNLANAKSQNISGEQFNRTATPPTPPENEINGLDVGKPGSIKTQQQLENRRKLKEQGIDPETGEQLAGTAKPASSVENSSASNQALQGDAHEAATAQASSDTTTFPVGGPEAKAESISLQSGGGGGSGISGGSYNAAVAGVQKGRANEQMLERIAQNKANFETDLKALIGKGNRAYSEGIEGLTKSYGMEYRKGMTSAERKAMADQHWASQVGEGPSAQDYFYGYHGPAFVGAGLGGAALLNFMNSKGQRSNAELYSDPFA